MGTNPLDVNLPKWSALTVVGGHVTTDQAAEIIVRTDSWYFYCNDRDLTRQLRATARLSEYCSKSKTYKEVLADAEHDDEIKKRYRVLELEFLHNCQIVSSYVGGPHGWCHWDGRILCNSYNIGKWPTADGVLKEWELIASAFPYLRLRSQLYSGETLEDGRPLIEYVVADGRVEAKVPESELIPRTTDFSMAAAASIAFVPPYLREFGCTIEQFKRALEIVEK